jgi:hypothetical protein
MATDKDKKKKSWLKEIQEQEELLGFEPDPAYEAHWKELVEGLMNDPEMDEESKKILKDEFLE